MNRLHCVCETVARQVTATFSRRFPNIDADDITQEAWAAMLPKLSDIDESKATANTFLYLVATVAVKRFVWRTIAITAVPRRESTKGAALRERAAACDDSALAFVPADDKTAESLLIDRELQADLAAVVAAHLAAGNEGKAVLAVLSGDMKSNEAAQAHNVPVETIYYQTRRTKAAIRKSLEARHAN